MTIDRHRPIRFVDGNTRVRIAGQAGGTDLFIRYHDGDWQTAKITRDGSPINYATQKRIGAVENYDIDWDRPVAFIDTGERGWLSHRTEGDGPIVFVTDGGDGRYLYTAAGMSMKRDGDFEIAARDLMNVETNYTRQRDAKERIETLKAARAKEREEHESHPLWGTF